MKERSKPKYDITDMHAIATGQELTEGQLKMQYKNNVPVPLTEKGLKKFKEKNKGGLIYPDL